MQYSSESTQTNAKTNLKGTQWGFRFNSETWLGSLLGVGVDGDYTFAEFASNSALALKGKPIYHFYTSIDLLLRLFGSGGIKNTEIVLMAGPALSIFSNVMSYYNQNFYDLNRANLLGLKGGARFRFSLSNKWLLDLEGYWIVPYRIITAGNRTLSKASTHSYGWMVALEYFWVDSLNLGFGYVSQNNHLFYTQDAQSQDTSFKRDAPLVYCTFWI